MRNYIRSFQKTQRAVEQAVEMHAPRCTWNLSSAFCMLPRGIRGLAVLAIDTFSTFSWGPASLRIGGARRSFVLFGCMLSFAMPPSPFGAQARFS